jgi:predicted dehydrogenase
VLAHPGVELVLNLTTPDAHVEVTSAAIAAGKHVWSEKPLGLDRDASAALLDQARTAGVRVGSAPDTLLGPGFQSAKRAIAAGIIGQPLFARTAFQTQQGRSGRSAPAPTPGRCSRSRCRRRSRC